MKMTSGNERTEPLNGMQMYYDIRGEGEPLVLLHGGTGIGADFGNSSSKIRPRITG